MKGSLIGLGFILFFAFGIFQLIIGYQGIEYHLGSGWAIAALIGTFVFLFCSLKIGPFIVRKIL